MPAEIGVIGEHGGDGSQNQHAGHGKGDEFQGVFLQKIAEAIQKQRIPPGFQNILPGGVKGGIPLFLPRRKMPQGIGRSPP